MKLLLKGSVGVAGMQQGLLHFQVHLLSTFMQVTGATASTQSNDTIRETLIDMVLALFPNVMLVLLMAASASSSLTQDLIS